MAETARLRLVLQPAPNSQLAQNIAASYYAGRRFFELKTVQIMDDELGSMCQQAMYQADDEAQLWWSAELYVPQAQDEYIKAWFLLSFKGIRPWQYGWFPV